MQGLAALRRRGQLWDRLIRGPVRLAVSGGFLVGLVGLALLSRQGTDLARNVALSIAVFSALLLLAGVTRSLRNRKDSAAAVRRVLIPVDAEVGKRALRALRLIDGSTAEGPAEGSVHSQEDDPGAATQVLAQLHLARTVERIPEAKVRLVAQRRAGQYRLLGATLAFLFLVVNLLRPREVAEGLNLLATAGERAPLSMHWIERLVVTARPPSYLRMAERRILSGGRTVVPVGTELTLRAVALHEERRLVITDGTQEQAFVSDGSGGLVAHFTIVENTRLQVAARFGERLILEEQSTILIAKPDRAPRVRLEGAPRTQSLAEIKRLPLRWAIEDDHGLRQVDLVLRSGYREERRSLSHFETEITRHQGGTVLRADDEFLKTLFLPTEIRIEARDNYPLGDEPQWGRSEPIVLVPTAVGEPEALRYAALTAARDQFVTALAKGEGNSDSARDSEVWGQALEQLKGALSKNYAGLRVPSGLRAFIEGRVRWVQEQVGQKGDEQTLHGLENLILSLDDALSQLARRDAQSVSKLLATVADETEARAQWVAAPETPSAGVEQLEESLYALQSGAAQLVTLGRLGQDLGTVAMASLGRIGVAREKSDWFHVALAAQHLAERLRRPKPSFGSTGGKGSGSGDGQDGSSGGSGESAGGDPSGGKSSGDRSQGGDSKEPPSTHSFDELARQIAELARQHGRAISAVSRAVKDGGTNQSMTEQERARAQALAEQLRQVVEPLPLPGHLPGSVGATASLGREHSRAMSHGLEGMDFERALNSGRSARSAISKALGQVRRNEYLRRQLTRASEVLADSLRWVEQQVRSQRSKSRSRARSKLADTAEVERHLAGLTGELAVRGQSEQTSLPREVIDRLQQARSLMQQASSSLSNGLGQEGLTAQRRAQRLLEQADRGQTQPPPSSGDKNSSGGAAAEVDDTVPDEGAQDPAAEFRRRVMENLGSARSGKLAPAIKRYAEGLLN